MKLLNTLLIIVLCLSCSAPQVQKKPMVAVVVWDENAQEGQSLGEIRVYQLGEPVPGLKVKIKYEGTASEGIDYRCYDNVLTVDKYQKVVVRPILDGIVEGPEDVTVRILESDDYEIDTEYGNASVTIFDGDLPDVEFEASSSIHEESIEKGEVKIRLSRTYDKDVEIDYTVQGVLAVEGEDFQFDSNRLVIPAGETGGSIKFRVKEDDVPEDEETVVIRMVGAINASIATIESHYYTIKNDDGEPNRSVVYDRIYGALLGFRAGCAMGAITEYNWPQDRIQEIFGFQDEFIPYKHYGDTWTHPAGATEDGGERHKLICTAIIEKQDRISYKELKDVWLRDCEMEDMFYMTQNYDRVLLAFAKWGVEPADMPITKFGKPRDLGEHIHLTARTFQALPCINAGDPENVIADMNDMGKLYYEDPNDDAFAWGAVYNAAMALAMLPDATVESVIDGALKYGTPEIEEEIRYAIAITEKYDDPMDRDMWQELSDMYMDPESKYNAFARIEKYPNSSIFENVGFAFALFKATNADIRQSVLIATNRGYDADCTAASAAALCGALSGTSKIPADWIETLDSGTGLNPYTNAHFTNKATADGLYRALQQKVYRMEKEANAMKNNKEEAKKIKDYVSLMKKAGVID
ncbi:MAG: ADP-ribosylglycohydrolase family protein [Cyclobacteriaceae bacterium]|nr:ADP-ribosylglycohydrolase family protein [Cyclobacteriaceae bacterium]